MARKTSLYYNQLSQDKKTLWRELKHVAFYLRKPRGGAAKNTFNAFEHLTIRFKDPKKNYGYDVSGRVDSTDSHYFVRLNRREMKSLQRFLANGSNFWRFTSPPAWFVN